MNRNTFENEFDKLVDVYNPTKPQNRARIYWEELKEKSDKGFIAAVKKYLRENETGRFPTIAWFLNAINALEAKPSYERVDCNVCGGTGFEFIGNKAFRARCCHGDLKSHKITRMPETPDIELFNQKTQYRKLYGRNMPENSSSFVSGQSWLEVMTQNPERWLNGFKVTHRLMKTINQKLFSEVRKTAIHFYGVEYLKKHWGDPDKILDMKKT